MDFSNLRNWLAETNAPLMKGQKPFREGMKKKEYKLFLNSIVSLWQSHLVFMDFQALTQTITALKKAIISFSCYFLLWMTKTYKRMTEYRQNF